MLFLALLNGQKDGPRQGERGRAPPAAHGRASLGSESRRLGQCQCNVAVCFVVVVGGGGATFGSEEGGVRPDAALHRRRTRRRCWRSCCCFCLRDPAGTEGRRWDDGERASAKRERERESPISFFQFRRRNHFLSVALQNSLACVSRRCGLFLSVLTARRDKADNVSFIRMKRRPIARVENAQI